MQNVQSRGSPGLELRTTALSVHWLYTIYNYALWKLMSALDNVLYGFGHQDKWLCPQIVPCLWVYGTISDILFKRFSTQVTLSKNKKVQKLSLGQLPKGSIFVLNVRN